MVTVRPLSPRQRPPAARAAMLAIGVATPALAMISPSPVPLALAGVSLIVIVALLWHGDDPPILLLPVLFQWSEVAILPVATTWRDAPLNTFSVYGANLEMSAIYGLAGVTALALGLRWGSRSKGSPCFAERLERDARLWSYEQVLRFGIGAMLLGYVLAALTSVAGPARELIGNATGVKYVGVFVIAYWCLANERHYGLLASVALFEVVFGMTGFFAEFKNSVLTLVVAVIAARPRIRPSDIVATALVGTLLIGVATFWTAVKVDYRAFVNRGSGAQVVAVPIDDRLAFIAREAMDIDGEMLGKGFEALVNRHGYIDYLALVMHSVPTTIPHEDGKLTVNVISHITMPRLLFPDKPPLPNDTEVMRKYTGLSFLRWDDNTSISIGNLGELYIDFGYFGGLIAEFVIGFIVASMYRILRDQRGCPALISAGLCVMVVLPVAYFGTAYVKLVGAFVFTAVLAWAGQRYIVPLTLQSSVAYPGAAPRAGR